jgi:T5SS/PEP-CTERM-associated repeat protein
VIVSGANSRWHNEPAGQSSFQPFELYVGYSGQGELTISDGGKVKSAYGYVAYNNESKGDILVTGSGSELTISRDLVLAGSLAFARTSTANLTVENDARVIVDGTLKLHSGGTLSGDRGIVEANVVSSGVVAPGSSPGILTIDGNYTQEAAGQLNIEIAGLLDGEYDQLIVTGDANLLGFINIAFLDNFAPEIGDSFDILRVGGALNMSGTALRYDGNQNLQFVSTINDGNLTITAVPESSTFMLCTIGLALSGALIRCSRKSPPLPYEDKCYADAAR